jgi:hypothetical protein
VRRGVCAGGRACMCGWVRGPAGGAGVDGWVGAWLGARVCGGVLSWVGG